MDTLLALLGSFAAQQLGIDAAAEAEVTGAATDPGALVLMTVGVSIVVYATWRRGKLRRARRAG